MGGGNSPVVIDNQGINAGNKVINGVALGEISPNSQQAINGSQLYQAANVINNNINRGLDKLNGRINDVDKNTRAGIASSAAIAGIPQVYLPGKSRVGVGVGNHRGQSALAVGYSRTSDNSKHIIKLSAEMDSQSHDSLSAGYMYQW